MKNRFFSILALASVVSFAACGEKEAEVGDADALATDTTVTTVPGTEVVSQPVVVPTTDSVVTATTTAVTVDTMEGSVTPPVTTTP